MKPQNDTPELNQQPDAVQAKDAPQLSRRKFIMTAGVSSLPVMMSLKSGDAWGCVGLDCTAGTGNYSGTRSAVLSAQKTKGSSYVVPKWDTISNIKKVVTVDFGRKVTTEYYGFLLNHYDFACYLDGSKYVRISDTNKSISSWKSVATHYMNKDGLYIVRGGKVESFKEWTDTSGRKYPLILPAHYDNTVLTGQTKLNSILNLTSRLNKTIIEALNLPDGVDDFAKYFTAAFVGSVWESHPIWATGYPGAVKNTRCYPKPAELKTALQNVITINSKTHKDGVDGALNDMGTLFRMYTKTVI